MKVYIQPKGITLVGKSWQIKHMLKQYASRYHTVEEWISSSQPKSKPSLKVLP
ncbi:Z-ring formation inhibitor MciZ [Fictibacillus aquaticus]|uniref:Z-ring formation inhibitor MciZ n=1 Tax=Fictibacillus aquaticus TaxID=2021314 RepID=A0A235FBJ3_9BACL|nr:Z-ring formation inhibitor MciZ [Fictibacillus aquaticus]OYD58384.1 Z-ring formation inhibitor MciZ [Fictibacillus aquaticus]